MEPTQLTIAQARAEIRGGRLSCVELADSSLTAIDHYDSTLHAFITVRPREAVLKDARDLDGRSRDDLPLRGIPVALKDNYATAGLRTTAGSRVLADWIPERDANVVAKLREAGALLVGKLNMHEFADGPTNDNPHWGRSLNPWHMDRTSGGSSGGSAVALAAGMCLGATGTDTGGSIRTPAAFCAVVGLKPTFGLVGRSGIVPFSVSLDHAGPMARTVRDVAILLNVMAGYDAADPGSADRPSIDYEQQLDDGIRGLRVGIETSYLTAVMSPGVRVAFNEALVNLTTLGAEIVEIQIPILRASLAAETTILFPEAIALHGPTLDSLMHDYGRDVRLSLLSGRLYTAVDYVKALRVRSLLRAELDRALATRVDVLAMPTVVMEPPEWGQQTYRIEGVEYDTLNAFIRCTAPFNLSGHPAVSVPCGRGEHGLPVGLQFVGRWFEEATVLRVGHAFEQSRLPMKPDFSWAGSADARA